MQFSKLLPAAIAAIFVSGSAYAQTSAYSQEDLRFAASTILGEAWGESEAGRLAVFEVLECRVRQSGKSLKHEALKPWQFSAWNHDAPFADSMLALAEGSSSGRLDMDRAFDQILKQVSTASRTPARQRLLPDDVCHYWAHETMKTPPYWYNGEPTIVLARHTFASGIK